MTTGTAVLFCFFLLLHFVDATIAETEYYGTNWNDAAVEAVEAVDAVNEVLRIENAVETLCFPDEDFRWP
jgi:hypothetical protein